MADWKFLDYKNRQDGVINQDDLPDPDCENSPVSFPDNDTPVEFLFSASLADVKRMLSALEKGAQLSYPNDWHNVWWLFVKNLECALSICDAFADCLTAENEAVVEALAALIRNNQTIISAIADSLSSGGGAVPGRSLTDSQAREDVLPENVRDGEGDCILDALWGGTLYLVQSGNRAITDVFEIIESASNTLENMEIISRNIPAAGDYIATAAAFADQLQEVIAEGYSAAYTETFEENLACAIFCTARTDCELSVDDLMDIMNARLSEPMDLGDFGEIMAGIATGTWVGDDIANVAFLLFFAALRFGQQFGGTVGIRPLDILMSLGADQLASDNWETLCDCPEIWDYAFPDGDNWDAWTLNDFAGAQTAVVATALVGAENTTNNANFLSAEIVATGDVSHFEFDVAWIDGNSGNACILYVDGTPVETQELLASGTRTVGASGTWTGMHTYSILMGINGGTGATRHTEVTAARFNGDGTNPFE